MKLRLGYTAEENSYLFLHQMESFSRQSTASGSSRKPRNSIIHHAPLQRRAGTLKMPDEHPLAQRDQPFENETKDGASEPEKGPRKRRSTFDPKFKGWRGPVHEGSTLSPPSSGSTPSSPALKKSSTSRACSSLSKDQSRPSTSSVVVDNNYYRSIVRRSISSSKQVPRVPIVPRHVGVPNVDWEGLIRIDSRDSCVQRRSAFEWERPDSPDVHRLPRTRPFMQTISCSSASSVSVSVTESEEEQEDMVVTTERTRQQGETTESDFGLQRDLDENGRMSGLIREVIRLRAINSHLKDEISDLKKRNSQQPE